VPPLPELVAAPAQHTSDQFPFSLVLPLSLRTSAPQALGVPRVALLFLTRGELPHHETWRLWFEAAAGMLPVEQLRAAACPATQAAAASTAPAAELEWQEHQPSWRPADSRPVQESWQEGLTERADACGWNASSGQTLQGSSGGPIEQQHLFSVYIHGPPNITGGVGRCLHTQQGQEEKLMLGRQGGTASRPSPAGCPCVQPGIAPHPLCRRAPSQPLPQPPHPRPHLSRVGNAPGKPPLQPANPRLKHLSVVASTNVAPLMGRQRRKDLSFSTSARCLAHAPPPPPPFPLSLQLVEATRYLLWEAFKDPLNQR
jgi:hypothetical protein